MVSVSIRTVATAAAAAETAPLEIACGEDHQFALELVVTPFGQLTFE